MSQGNRYPLCVIAAVRMFALENMKVTVRPLLNSAFTT